MNSMFKIGINISKIINHANVIIPNKILFIPNISSKG